MATARPGPADSASRAERAGWPPVTLSPLDRVFGRPLLRIGSQNHLSFTEIVELRLVPHQAVTLIRSDGYVAYSGHDRDSNAALTLVRSLLERQINSAISITTRAVGLKI